MSGTTYASTIGSVTPQTIGSGDFIGAGWFQAVNDRLPPVL
jgi:hypothetical protein